MTPESYIIEEYYEENKEENIPPPPTTMSELISYTPQELITSAFAGATSKVTLDMPEDKCYSHFSSISDVHDFVARLAIKSGKQGSVQDLGEIIRVELG